MTDIKGCGRVIEKKIRETFFSILSKIVPRIDGAEGSELKMLL